MRPLQHVAKSNLDTSGLVPVSKTYVPNNLNQYSSVNSDTHTYDLNGNMTGRGTNTYSWDYNNRLAGAVIGSKSISYRYNYQDIRLEKSINSAVTRYYYNGAKLLAEGDGNRIHKIVKSGV